MSSPLRSVDRDVRSHSQYGKSRELRSRRPGLGHNGDREAQRQRKEFEREGGDFENVEVLRNLPYESTVVEAFVFMTGHTIHASKRSVNQL